MCQARLRVHERYLPRERPNRYCRHGKTRTNWQYCRPPGCQYPLQLLKLGNKLRHELHGQSPIKIPRQVAGYFLIEYILSEIFVKLLCILVLAKLSKCFGFNLANTFTSNGKFLAHFFKCVALAVLKTKTHLHNLLLALG